MLSALELQSRAKAATNLGHHERALTLLALAEERAETPDEHAMIAGTAGYASLELGRLEPALQLVDRSVAMAATSETRGIVLGQRAVVLGRIGRLDDALRDFDAAIDALRDRPEFLARSLLNRGTIRMRMASAGEAADDFEAAMAAFRTAGLEASAAKAEHNLGYARMLTGDLVAALEHLDRSRLVLGRDSALTRAFCTISQAETMLLAGLREKALRQLAGAAASLGRGHARRSAAEARAVLARHLAQDRPAEAAAQAGRAAAQFRAMGAEAEAAAAESIQLSCRLLRGAGSIGRAREMVATLSGLGLDRERDLLRLHILAAELRSGAPTAAEFEAPRSEEAETRLLAAEVGARHDVARGRPEAALARIARALDEQQALRVGVGSLDLATSLSRRTGRLAALALELAVADGDPAVILKWTEHTRAATSRIVPVRPAPDPEVARALAELRQLAGDDKDRARQEELRRAIREATWHSPAARAALDVVDLATLRRAADRAGAAWVTFVLTGDDLSALVVGERVSLVPLGAPRLRARLATLFGDLDAAASPLSDGVGAALAGSLQGELQRLSDELVAPWLHLVGGRSLLLAPSGPLHRVPWSLLPGLRGRAVSIPRSATLWVRRWRSTPDAGQRVLLIAGPRLRHAEREVAELRALWTSRADVLIGDDATAPRVAAGAADARIVHIAAHGARSAENPLFSRVELADGPLYAYDVERMGRLPELVVLSACDVGTAAERADDPLGLPTALLHAGVRTVIAPLTRVGDEAARLFSVALHEGLLAGRSPAEAMSHALQALPDGCVAPFGCFGDGIRPMGSTTTPDSAHFT